MATITGTNGSNIIVGTNAGDVVDAKGGNDIVLAGNGDDAIDGGSGDDALSGGNGNDTILGGLGDDLISGDNGNDILDGGAGRDLLFGGNGNDLLIHRESENGSSYDIYDGGKGTDTLRLVVTQTTYNSAAFQSDLAELQAKLSRGSATHYLDSLNLLVTSIERVEVVIEGGGGNQPPATAPVTLAAIAEDSGPRLITQAQLLANASDPDGGPLTAVNLTIATGSGSLVDNGNGTWTYTPALNDDSAVSFSYQVTDGTASVAGSATLDITPVNDAPEAQAQQLATDEDVAVSGTLTANDIDSADADFALVGGSAVGGTVTAFDAETGDFTFAPSANFSGTASFQFIASDGTDNSAPRTITIEVAPVADDPIITTAPASGTADAPIPLDISIALADLDGSESIQTIEVRGVPSTYTLSAGTQIDEGNWLVTTADLAGLSLVPVGAAGQHGSLQLEIVATSIDGTDTATSSATLSVSIDPPANSQSGIVSDGYIAGATVFADANNNGLLDDGEAFATTAANGTFTLVGGTGPLIMFGGIDVLTGLPFEGTLKAPEGSTVVTPLTTLVTELATTLGDVASAETAVLAAFGLALPAGTSLQDYDPIPDAIAGDPGATAVLSAAIQVQSTITQVAAVGGSGDTVIVAIADTIAGAAGGAVDLGASATVEAIATGSGVSTEAVAAVTEVVTAAVQSIQSAASVTEIAQAAVVAQGEATAALASTDFQNQAEIDALTQTFVSDLDTQVSNAEVGDVDGPLVGTIGIDNLAGTAGIDVIEGLDGDDTIDGGAGNDLLYGGAGNDRITGGLGGDQLFGDRGFDRSLYENAAAAVAVDMGTGIVTGGDGTDRLREVESVRGSAFGDSYDASGYTATSDNRSSDFGTFNEFEGMGGNDVITGNGNTRISYQNATAGVTVNLSLGTAIGDASVGEDTITGGVLHVRGSSHNDTLIGSLNTTGFETFEGRQGDDFIDGNGGADRVRYDQQNTGALGITVNLGAGTVTGRDASATAVVGTDTLRSIESVRGTNAADIYDASTFTATSTNGGGDQGGFNEFEGMGGNDQIIGSGSTRLSFTQATAGVTANIATGIASGDGSVGTDTFSGVAALRGSAFNDTLIGSNNAAGTTEQFEGWNGDDLINGGGGFDRVRYDVNNTVSTGIPLVLGVSVNMTTGVVTGRDSIATATYGTDTLRRIESVRGTVADDIYDATNFGAAGFIDPNMNNVGDNGTLNEFEGMDGDDTITGNGNTRVSYVGASAGVTVALGAGGSGSAFSTLPGDAANIGTDTFTGGVFSVRGSQFDDTVSGTGSNDTLDGQGGNDSLSGGNGNDILIGGTGNDTLNGGGGIDIARFGGSRSLYTFTANTVSGPDGTDTTNGVELLQFDDAYMLGLAGTPINLTGFGLNAGVALFGRGGRTADDLTMGANASGRLIDLSTGADILRLGTSGASYSLNLANVENVTGAGGNETVTLVNAASGMSIDLLGGFDTLNLSGAGNTANVTNVETLNAFGSGNDTITFVADISFFQTINLGTGTDVLNLAGSNANLSMSLSAASLTVNDQIVGGNLNLTLSNSQFGTTFNFGGGTDSLTLAGGGNTVSVSGVETVIAVGAGNDTVSLDADSQQATAVDLGDGFNVLNLIGNDAFLQLNLIGPMTVYDQNSGFDQNLTLELLNQQLGDVTIDFGAGSNDSLLLADTDNQIAVRNVESVTGGSGADHVTVDNGSTTGSTAFDLGDGIDTVTLASVQAAYSLSLTGVENLFSNGGVETVDLLLPATDLNVDLGLGFHILNLHGLGNTLTVANVFVLNDLAGGDDTVNFIANDTVTNQVVDLGGGTNVLNLQGTDDVLTMSFSGDQLTVNDQTAGGNLTLHLLNEQSGTTFDFAGGNLDSLHLGTPTTANVVTVVGIEDVFGSSGADEITVGANANGTTVTGGWSADILVAGADTDRFRFTTIQDSSASVGSTDLIVNFDAAMDIFQFEGMNFVSAIDFIGDADFSGSGFVSEARLANGVLTIDVDGDGQIGANDMDFGLLNLQGILTNANFSLL